MKTYKVGRPCEGVRFPASRLSIAEHCRWKPIDPHLDKSGGKSVDHLSWKNLVVKKNDEYNNRNDSENNTMYVMSLGRS